MCGSSSQQNQISAQQDAFYQQQTQQQSQLFGEQQGVLSQLQKEFAPILKAGPNQQGYNPAELTALNTSAEDGVSGDYTHAAQALNGNYAAAGGGNEYVPSGAQAQMDAGVATGAAQQLAGEQNQITQADYAQGNANFNTAASALSGVAGQYNAIGAAGTANSGGADAANTANQIASENNAWMGALGGAVGAAGAAAVTKFA